jgi:hypothetical protein
MDFMRTSTDEAGRFITRTTPLNATDPITQVQVYKQVNKRDDTDTLKNTVVHVYGPVEIDGKGRRWMRAWVGHLK